MIRRHVLFPAGAGMNLDNQLWAFDWLLFPAGAGMNRYRRLRPTPTRSVPRRRGDEPTKNSVIYDPVVCSPQARG